jgi:histidinol-phosphate aminotransferase
LADLEELLELPLTVVVDEAYVAFGGATAIPLLERRQNLAIIRTFSKWAGLAGIRIGYVVGGPGLIGSLERIRAPYNVSSAAVAAALATLDDLDAVMANVRRLVAERERMQAELARFDWLDPVPGKGNFILMRVDRMTGSALADGLAARGILVQAFSEPSLTSFVRLTIGRPEQNDVVLQALERVDTGLRSAAQ